MKRTILALILGLSLMACNAFATTYHFDDTWKDWPGFTSNIPNIDKNGTPDVRSMDVTVDGDHITTIDINLGASKVQYFNSLFINASYDGSTFDDWTNFVHDGGTQNSNSTIGAIPLNGFYSVTDSYTYTMSGTQNGIRKNSPNGIDAGSLTDIQSIAIVYSTVNNPYIKTISYDLTSLSGGGLEFDGGFFVAYAPWCDNDIIGGGTAPVPEPATLILLGSGLAGLAFYRRRMKK